MQFLNPIWLWGLTGTLIPIGIHLLSRKDGRTIKIGSVRHLDDNDTKQFKSLRLNEIALLALRCLLIATLVLILSGLHFKGAEKKRSRWLLIEKGLEHDPRFSYLIDSLAHNNFEIKVLAPGFPNFRDSIQIAEPINYWDLMGDLKEESLDQAIVLSYSYAVGFRGLRPPLPTNVQWISKNPMPVDFPLQAIRMSNDSVSLQIGKSAGNETAFSTRSISANASQRYFKFTAADSIPINVPDTISIAVMSDPKFQYDKKILMASLAALKESSIHVLDIDTAGVESALEKKANWVIWISDKPSPLFRTNTINYQNNDSLGETNLLQQNDRSNGNHSSWVLTKRLNEHVALYNNLTVQLALMLLPRAKPEARAFAFDKRTLPEKTMWDTKSYSTSGFKVTAKRASTEKIMAILFFVILMIERFLAYKRGQ